MPVRLGDDRREVVGEASSPLRFVAPSGDACCEISRTDSLTTGFDPSGCTQEEENMLFTQSQGLWLLTQSQGLWLLTQSQGLWRLTQSHCSTDL